ncbi:MAG: hypothetical protein OEX07_04405 [Gammaproteobacteria bacterium]|nr:hypothetical protein [Gammaproteobacteria bacterium]
MGGKNSKKAKEAKAALQENTKQASVPDVVDEPVLPCEVTPLIALSNKTVAVNGIKQIMVLKANKDSVGKSILTCTGADKIKLTIDDQPLVLNSGKAEFPDITKTGHTLKIEAVDFSPVDGISFKWEVQPDSDNPGDAATIKMTAIKATLDIHKKSDEALTVDEKAGNGRTILLQNADKKMSRAKIILKCEPADYADDLVLESVNDKIKIFDAATDGNEKQPLPLSIPVGPGKTLAPLYIEGAKVSDAVVDSGIKLKIKSSDDTVDGSKLTILDVKIQICDDQKSALSPADKINPGRLLLKQDAKFNFLRAKLSVIKKPKDATCKIKLKSSNDKVKLFPAANEKHVDSETTVALPKEIDISDISDEAKGLEFWAEGAELTSLGESVFEVDAIDVDDACDKVLISVAELRNGDDSDVAPWLLPVKNKITEPANTHINKIKLKHNFGAGSYAWDSSCTKVELADKTTDTVKLTSKEIPSSASKTEALKIIFTPSGKNAFAVCEHKFSVVKLEFIENASHPGGYDKYEILNCISQGGSAYTDDPTDKYDFISIEKSTDGKVDVKFEGAEPAELFFTSDDEAISKPKVETAASASPCTLEITGKAKDKDETILNARLMSKTGPIIAKLGTVVLKKATYQAELFRVQDSASAGTNVSHALTGAAATTGLANDFKGGISTLTISGAASVTNAAYDTSPGCTNNGKLDMEPGVTSIEQSKIIAACVSTKTRIIYVHELRWSYYLRADAAIGATTLKFKSAYAGAYIGYIGVNNRYKIEDSDGNTEIVKVTAVNKVTKEITIETATTKVFTAAKNAALIWPLGGLSGNPAWVQDSPTQDDVIEVIGHELGHQLCGFKDICEKANLMYGVNSRTSKRLRHRPIDRLYGGTGKEKQWLTMNR